ncbi:MAG: phenylacetate--CoA ligase family protein, partial [Burkholderiales bacterium]
CLAHGIKIPALKQARAFGETLKPDLRELCQRAWGVPVIDTYSAEEIGYIALQCPRHEHYHVQSENVLVEILDEQGRPCTPGEIGRVVITTLHNYAMPLIRYQIMDYAQAGEPCACGRGLPVITRVLGRERNLLTLPDGTLRWPSFLSQRWSSIAPLRQIQLRQRSVENIDFYYVAQRVLSASEKSALVTVFQELLGYPFHIELHHVDEIRYSPNFKYEDFVSELAPAGGARTG